MQIEIHLPWPPTVNSYYGHKPVKRRIIPYIKKAGKDYRAAVHEAVVEQVGYLNLDENLLVEVVLFPPDKRKRDLDNYMKALLDALTHAQVWEDDSQIEQLHIYRGIQMPKGLVSIRIGHGGPIVPSLDSV